MKKEKLFQHIAGYENVKKELMIIYGWYQDKEILNNKKINIPSGILFYGQPGNGKTLFIREYVKALKAPSFNIRSVKEIKESFDKARKEKFALVLIDEIDLLIKDSPDALRTLLGELDGINQKGQILVLATTNSIRSLPDALTRPGRFDRLIRIASPERDEIIELFKYYLNELNIDAKDFDFAQIIGLLNGSNCSCTQVKQICNDAYLRNKKNIDAYKLEESTKRVVLGEMIEDDVCKYRNYRVAIHEAGHAIMSLRFKKDIKFYTAKFNKHGGFTYTYPLDADNDTIEKRFEEIQIALAGAIAERIFFKRHDIGSVPDLDRTHGLVERLVERTGYKGFSNFVEKMFTSEGFKRDDTVFHQHNNEKIERKILRSQEKAVTRYLKKEKVAIKAFADLLYKKGEVTSEDVIKLFNHKVSTKPINSHLIPRLCPAFYIDKEENENK